MEKFPCVISEDASYMYVIGEKSHLGCPPFTDISLQHRGISVSGSCGTVTLYVFTPFVKKKKDHKSCCSTSSVSGGWVLGQVRYVILVRWMSQGPS